MVQRTEWHFHYYLYSYPESSGIHGHKLYTSYAKWYLNPQVVHQKSHQLQLTSVTLSDLG